MAYRLAIAFGVVLLATSPVLAQESGQELELGGGWFQTNPFDGIYDLSGPSGPSANFAWTRWRNERTGITVGVTTILPREGNDIVGRVFNYGHITWRRRWLQSEGHGSVHVGLGVGPTVFWETNPVLKWNPEMQVRYYDGEAGLKCRFLWHAELYFTRRVRDGLSLRGGIAVTPIPYLPPLLIAQPVLMAVWKL